MTILYYRCPEGHKHSITWRNWQQGYRCPYCNGKIDINIDYIRNELLKENYILLSNKYINAHAYLKVKCPKGHIYQVKWHNWKSGKRCPECNKINLSINRMGEKHHNWCGGVANGPYCEIWKDQEYKQDIRERDGNRCLNPYCTSKNPNDFTIHHIDYNKQNCHPSNLITVCRSCNSRANTNRTWHKAWYQTIMKNRYGVKVTGKTNA
jgi:hypothetical protein